MVNCEQEDEKTVLPGVSVPLMFNNSAIGVLGIVGDPAEVETYVQLVKSHVEMMCQEAFRKEMMELEAKMVEVFVQQLIHFPDDADPEIARRYAQMLGYDLDTNRICLLVDIQMERGNLPADKFSLPIFQRDVLDFLALVFRDTRADIISMLNMGQFIIIKPMKNPDNRNLFMNGLEQKLQKVNKFLETKYQLSAVMAVGDSKTGISSIADSYRSAAKALMAGKKTNQEPPIYFYNDWYITLEMLPKELSPDAQKKLSSLTEPLIAYDNADILTSTFLAYCRNNMNLSETARNLYIHRNTIIYRLEKINELTGLNTTLFEHCLLLYLAIRQHDHEYKA